MSKFRGALYSDPKLNVHITDGDYSVEVIDEDVVIKVGDGSITVKQMNGKEITIIDSEGNSTTEVYGETESNVSSLWFIEDDSDFVGNSVDFDSMIKNDSSSVLFLDKIGEWKIFEPENNLVTAYSESKN